MRSLHRHYLAVLTHTKCNPGSPDNKLKTDTIFRFPYASDPIILKATVPPEFRGQP